MNNIPKIYTECLLKNVHNYDIDVKDEKTIDLLKGYKFKIRSYRSKESIQLISLHKYRCSHDNINIFNENVLIVGYVYNYFTFEDIYIDENINGPTYIIIFVDKIYKYLKKYFNKSLNMKQRKKEEFSNYIYVYRHNMLYSYEEILVQSFISMEKSYTFSVAVLDIGLFSGLKYIVGK